MSITDSVAFLPHTDTKSDINTAPDTNTASYNTNTHTERDRKAHSIGYNSSKSPTIPDTHTATHRDSHATPNTHAYSRGAGP